MYQNRILFPYNTKTLNFITNARYSFNKLKDGTDSSSRSKIQGIELCDNDIRTCNTKIKDEHKMNVDPNFEAISNFLVTNLSNKDSSTHCIGALNKLINRLNPNNRINPELAYNQIYNEINRKTDYNISELIINDITSLIELKGLTKKQFVEILKNAGLYKSTSDEWEDLKASLENLHVGISEILKYKNAWRSMTATVLKDQSNAPLLKVTNQIKEMLDEAIAKDSIKDLTTVQVADLFSEKIKEPMFDLYFIKCLVIKALNEA
jgi:hypothetical protein